MSSLTITKLFLGPRERTYFAVKILSNKSITYENFVYPGTGEVGEYVTSLEGNVLVTKKVDTGDVIAKREFNDSGFVQTYYSKSVTATRTFKKA